MTNNYILRRLRYTFDLSDSNVIKLCAEGGLTVTREQISAWLKKDDDPAYIRCTDNEMAIFLNGFIVEKRGKKDGPAPVAEHQLNNNIIFRKLKIALNLIDEDILDIMRSANFILGKPELTALFRKPGHRSYRECQDQILRNFLKGIQIKYHKGGEAGVDNKQTANYKKTATPDKTQMAIKKQENDKQRSFEPKTVENKVVEKKTAEKKNDTSTSGFQWQPIDKK